MSAQLKYLAPEAFPPPEYIKDGLPTEDDLDDSVVLFTWGELKDIIVKSGSDGFSRNKTIEKRYAAWSKDIKKQYGGIDKYMTEARLPWAKRNRKLARIHTHKAIQKKQAVHEDEHESSEETEDENTVRDDEKPDSAAYVDLEAIQDRLQKDKKDKEHPDNDAYLRWEGGELDRSRYTVILNDWPYSIPREAKHYCVWSRIPIVHPSLVDYDKKEYEMICENGLQGFSGITPVQGAYKKDVEAGGPELKKWAGFEHEVKGGHEVGKMVAGLWDPKGWECIWFVNPAPLQSIPGFGHFHVFARRKPDDEIDVCEGKFLDDTNDDDDEEEEEEDDDDDADDDEADGEKDNREDGKEDKKKDGKLADKKADQNKDEKGNNKNKGGKKQSGHANDGK